MRARSAAMPGPVREDCQLLHPERHVTESLARVGSRRGSDSGETSAAPQASCTVRGGGGTVLTGTDASGSIGC